MTSGKHNEDCTEGLFQRRESDTMREIFKKCVILNVRKYTFTNRVFNTCNGLPEWVVNAITVKSFERKLNYRKTKNKKFRYKAHVVSSTIHDSK